MAKDNKKKNIFQRIAQTFKDVRLELKRVVWPSKDKLKTTSAVVLVVIVFFAVYLSIIGNGGRWLLEKVGFYQQVEPTETAETLADSGLSLSDESGEA
ncbi:MAG: preprotein translocase subunit SecE [Clostridiales bacterium]|nr:preprotein translocase subunit SecE [Clostridiales bacterium]